MVENKVLWRTLALAFFITSMLGPWTYELINVPAQYTCDKPFVRLYGDFCGSPMSGVKAFIWTAGGFFFLLNDLIQGNRIVHLPELITLTSMWIIVLPFFSLLLLLWHKHSHRLQIINFIAWGLACLPALTIFILQTNRDQLVRFFSLLWGVWLYILVAIGTIIFEILVFRSNTNPSGAI